jgi:hypothetical protein
MEAQPSFGKRGVVTSRAASGPRAAPPTVYPAGGRLATAPVVESSPALDLSSVDESDMKLAIGRNWAKYQQVWLNLDSGFPEASFARAGLLFGELWLLYRKQYAAFFVMLLAQMAIAYVAPGNARWLNLSISVLIAVIGKWWITRSAALMVVRTRSLGLSEAETERRIQRQGGVSWVGPIVFIAVIVALGVALGLSRLPPHH